MSRLTVIGLMLVVGSALAWQPPAPKSPETAPAKTPAASEGAKHSAVDPKPRTDEWWTKRHESFNARAKQGAEKGDIDLIFLGDSITQGWEGEGKEAWAKHFGPRKAVNFGIGGDRTQHVLWRLRNGNLAGLATPKAGSAPKLVVLMIGTNNSNGKDNSAEEIADGIKAIVGELRSALPQTKVLVLAIFPRGEKPNAQREKNARASELAKSAADGVNVRYLDIGPKFLEADGTLTKEVMPDLLHLSPKAYERWAEAILPVVKDMTGEK